MEITDVQREVCNRFGVDPLPPRAGTMVGIVLSRGAELRPLNATRHPSVGRTNGWYVWRGGDVPQDEADFFSAVHIEHIEDYAPELIPYLAMPPGWGVTLAPDYEDVWHDEAFSCSHQIWTRRPSRPRCTVTPCRLAGVLIRDQCI